jgi:hypothetical protein
VLVATACTSPPEDTANLGAEAKCRPLTNQMDVHNRQGPRQNGPRLSRHFQRVIITVQSQ